MKDNKESTVSNIEEAKNAGNNTTDIQTEVKQPEEKKGRSMIFWYGMLFLGYMVITGLISLFHVFDPVVNLLEPKTKLELNFKTIYTVHIIII